MKMIDILKNWDPKTPFTPEEQAHIAAFELCAIMAKLKGLPLAPLLTAEGLTPESVREYIGHDPALVARFERMFNGPGS